MPAYRFIKKPSGFCVERLPDDRLTVELEPWALWVRRERHPGERCSFYEGDRLALLIAKRLLGEDDAPASPPPPSSPYPYRPLPQAVREARAIATEVSLHRLRLVAQVDPAVHQVQLLALRTAGRIPSLAQEAALYREPYILKDILTYRAAAIAFACLQSELWRPVARGHEGTEHPGGRHGSGGCLAQPATEDPSCNGIGEECGPPVAELLDAMAHWRGLFSPDGKPYRSLNRTLMNLPPEVPPELVCCLNRIKLERPVVNWLEFTALMLGVSTLGAAPSDAGLSRLHIFQHATAAEIAHAMARIGSETNRELHPRRLEDLRFVVRFLCDYPEPYHGTLAGLAQRAIRWHRQVHERQRLEQLVRSLGGPDRPTARPPIPLPTVPGITFLATVGEVAEEGARMKHCIATRAPDAIKGRCFLFHVDYRGERASVEVSADGNIADAEGPRNTANAAVWWGPRTSEHGAQAFALAKPWNGLRSSKSPAAAPPPIRISSRFRSSGKGGSTAPALKTGAALRRRRSCD